MEKVEKILVCLEEDKLDSSYTYGVLDDKYSIERTITYGKKLFNKQMTGYLFKVSLDDTRISYNPKASPTTIKIGDSNYAYLPDNWRVEEARKTNQIRVKTIPSLDIGSMTLDQLKELARSSSYRTRQRDLLAYIINYIL